MRFVNVSSFGLVVSRREEGLSDDFVAVVMLYDYKICIISE